MQPSGLALTNRCSKSPLRVIACHSTRHATVTSFHLCQLHEGDIIEKLEQLCDASKPDGEWIRQIDMVEEGDAIQLKDMQKVRGRFGGPGELKGWDR